MAEVKWIKITTSMFDDEKIDFIESLPEADAILVIWIKLLAQAGKCNSGGFIFITERVPYTEESLAHKFRRPLNVVKLALSTFVNLDMIQMDEAGFLKITNWEKHQNIEGLEKIKEQNRLRKQKQREKQKLLGESHVTCHATVTPSHATEEDIDKELEREVEEDKKRDKDTTLSKDKICSILSEWNSLDLQELKAINTGTNRYKLLKVRISEYGFDEVLRAISSIKQSSFLRGQNDRGWTITFDWLIKPNNFVKVIEGNYLDKGGNGNGQGPGGNSAKTDYSYLVEQSKGNGLEEPDLDENEYM